MRSPDSPPPGKPIGWRRPTPFPLPGKSCKSKRRSGRASANAPRRRRNPRAGKRRAGIAGPAVNQNAACSPGPSFPAVASTARAPYCPRRVSTLVRSLNRIRKSKPSISMVRMLITRKQQVCSADPTPGDAMKQWIALLLAVANLVTGCRAETPRTRRAA
jgi:hypothetical protein